MGITARDTLLTTYVLVGQQIHHEDGSGPCISASSMVHPPCTPDSFAHIQWGKQFLQDSDEIWSINTKKMNYTHQLQLVSWLQLIPVISLLHCPFLVPFSFIYSCYWSGWLTDPDPHPWAVSLSDHYALLSQGLLSYPLSSRSRKGISGDAQEAGSPRVHMGSFSTHTRAWARYKVLSFTQCLVHAQQVSV